VSPAWKNDGLARGPDDADRALRPPTKPAARELCRKRPLRLNKLLTKLLTETTRFYRSCAVCAIRSRRSEISSGGRCLAGPTDLSAEGRWCRSW
jgi:hypothetical protein